MLFSLRRKQLGGILKAWRDDALLDFFSRNGLSERDRPENLSPKQLAELASLLKTRLAS
jgi:16S rRNA (adenine1518-N6/adenine1519-N6)-dimethyltransferase